MSGDIGLGSYYGAKEAAKAAKQAAWLQYQTYEQSREDLAPWRTTGANALDTLWGKVQTGPGEYKESPYYNFLASEGMKGIERSAAARGNLLGGATQKALVGYSENLASSDYDSWLKRWYQSLTPYQSLAGVGQTAGYQTGILGQAGAENAGNYLNQIGQYRAAGRIGAGNTIGNVGSSLGQLAQQIVGNYLSNQGSTQAFGGVSPSIYGNYGADISGLSGIGGVDWGSIDLTGIGGADWGGGNWL